MSAPVYVGKHRDGLNVWTIASTELRGEEAARVYQMWQRPALRHYKPCPDCHDSGDFWDGDFWDTTYPCHCASSTSLAPVAVVPSSPAVAVKAGGVATLTGGDTTQPETQR